MKMDKETGMLDMETNVLTKPADYYIPEKHCINCEGFVWWDGDFCCVRKFKLFCESKDGTYNDELLRAVKENKDCDEYKYVDSPVTRMYEEEYENYLKEKK